MKTLDDIREEVQDEDKRQFDKRVAGIRKKVYDAIESFGMTPGVDYEEGMYNFRTHVYKILCTMLYYSIRMHTLFKVTHVIKFSLSSGSRGVT